MIGAGFREGVAERCRSGVAGFLETRGSKIDFKLILIRLCSAHGAGSPCDGITFCERFCLVRRERRDDGRGRIDPGDDRVRCAAEGGRIRADTFIERDGCHLLELPERVRPDRSDRDTIHFGRDHDGGRDCRVIDCTQKRCRPVCIRIIEAVALNQTVKRDKGRVRFHDAVRRSEDIMRTLSGSDLRGSAFQIDIGNLLAAGQTQPVEGADRSRDAQRKQIAAPECMISDGIQLFRQHNKTFQRKISVKCFLLDLLKRCRKSEFSKRSREAVEHQDEDCDEGDTSAKTRHDDPPLYFLRVEKQYIKEPG